MADSVQIRRATSEDLAALADLGTRTFRGAFENENEPSDMAAYLEHTFALEQVGAELEDPTSIFLLALSDSVASPIGYAKLRGGEPHGAVEGPSPIEIERLYVLQEAIGLGVGASLMQACLDEAERAGHETVWLGVWERNRRAIGFYRRWGFEEVGSHVFHLGSDPQTDLVMVRPASRPDGS